MADKVITDAGVIEQIRNAMPISSDSIKGLMPSGIWMKKIISINPNSSITINPIYGIVYIVNKYMNSGIGALYLCGEASIVKYVGGEFGGLELTISNKTLTIKNNYSSPFTASIIYQDLSY